MKPTTISTAVIDRFELRYHLDPGLSDASSAEKWTETFAATRGGLSFALDRRDYECLRLRGCYGAAHASVYAIMGDGEKLVEDADESGDGISESRAYELLTSDGEVDADAVHALRCSVWDGNNHVDFTPARSLGHLSGEDAYERMGRALVRWNGDGGIDDIRIDAGWEIADECWGTLGNESWSHGKLTGQADDLSADEREAILAAAGIECDIVWLSDGDVLVLVPARQIPAARAVMDAATAENDD